MDEQTKKLQRCDAYIEQTKQYQELPAYEEVSAEELKHLEAARKIIQAAAAKKLAARLVMQAQIRKAQEGRRAEG